MFRLTRQSSLVLAVAAGLALLAIAGVAVARSVHLGAAPVRSHAVTGSASAAGAARSSATKPKTLAKPSHAKPEHKAKPKHRAKPKTHKKSTTRSAFAVAADNICSANRGTVHQIGAAATTWSLQQSELHDLVQATNSSLTKLEALTPPSKNAALARKYFSLTASSIQEFVSAQQRSTSTNEAVGVANERSDTAAAENSGNDALAAQAAARKLGMRVCGSSGAEWL
jgi:hypothetical protein